MKSLFKINPLFNFEDYKLCLVMDDSIMYFTTQDLHKQHGDDWDDKPYYYNAGEPYECGYYHYADGTSEKIESDWNKDGAPKWDILKIPFKCEAFTEMSEASVKDIIKHKNFFIGDSFLKNPDGLYPNMSIEEAVDCVWNHGGYIKIDDKYYDMFQYKVELIGI